MALPPVRRLSLDDLSACLALAVARDWGREEAKWRLLHEVGQVHGIDDPETGGLAATVTGTQYGPVMAISMMLVAERHERRGLGGHLMRHAIAQPGVTSARLTATGYGRPLYERLGFRSLGLMSAFIGDYTGSATATTVSRPATPDDMPEILALDTQSFGADRTRLLTRLPAFSEQFRVVDGPDGLAGFGGVWRNIDLAMIGPIVAKDTATAIGLISELAATTPGPTRIDLDHGRQDLIAWATAHGLKQAFTTTIMEYGEAVPADSTLRFAPIMQALG